MDVPSPLYLHEVVNGYRQLVCLPRQCENHVIIAMTLQSCCGHMTHREIWRRLIR